MENGRIPKDILYGQFATGKRDIGRPQLRYRDVVKRDLKALEIKTEHCEELTTDGLSWRSTVRLKTEEDTLMRSAEEKQKSAVTHTIHSMTSATCVMLRLVQPRTALFHQDN